MWVCVSGAHCAYPLSCKSGTNNSSSFSGDPSPADPAEEGDSRRRGGASGSVSVSVYDTDIITKDIKTLCKARHNNIVLFMAACRNPPAIITRSAAAAVGVVVTTPSFLFNKNTFMRRKPYFFEVHNFCEFLKTYFGRCENQLSAILEKIKTSPIGAVLTSLRKSKK